MRELITDSISSLLRSIKSLGGDVVDLIIEPPADEAELTQIEMSLGRTLPAELREFASRASRRIAFGWNLPEEFQLPDPMRGSFYGGLDYDISKIPAHEEGRA